jgi:hypothetical protein
MLAKLAENSFQKSTNVFMKASENIATSRWVDGTLGV